MIELQPGGAADRSIPTTVQSNSLMMRRSLPVPQPMARHGPCPSGRCAQHPSWVTDSVIVVEPGTDNQYGNPTTNLPGASRFSFGSGPNTGVAKGTRSRATAFRAASCGETSGDTDTFSSSSNRCSLH